MMDLPSLLHTQDDYLSQMQEQLLAAIETLDKTLAEMPELALQLAAYPDEIAQLRAKLDACQAQNDINGRLLELSMVSNRRLATFLSQLRDRNSLTYDAKGNTRSGTRSYGIKA